jgi:DeoR family suf operon transcriptional repressor
MQQWATALIGYRGLRSNLLIELKKAQPLTAGELGARFGLTANALRRHLKELEGAGLVHYRREVRGVGGPRFAYSLSEDGEALFPRAHAPALVDALTFLREREGPEAVVAFFRRRWAGILAESGVALGALALEDRVQLMAELLSSQGYMAEASAAPWQGAPGPAAGGCGLALTLRKYNCALREVAERFPELCAAEVEFMEEALGARLERRAHLLAGCNMCEYRVIEQSGGEAGAAAARVPGAPAPNDSQDVTEPRAGLNQEQS